MAKYAEFKEYKGSAEDVDGDSHETTVHAHVITEDTKHLEWQTRDGQTRKYPVGHVVVKTDHHAYHDVLSPEQWKQTDYGVDSEHDAESDDDE